MLIKLNNEKIYCLAFIIYFLSFIIHDTNLALLFPDSLINLVNLFAKLVVLILLFWVLINQKYKNYSELFTVIGIIGLTLISAKFSGSNYIFNTALFMLASKDISKKDFYNLASKTIFICLVFISTLAFLGIIQNKVEIRGEEGDSIRYALGFNHPNRVGCFTYAIIAMYEILNKNKVSYKKEIFPILFSVTIKIITDSNTSFLLTLLIIVASISITTYKKISKVFLSELKLSKKQKRFLLLGLTIFFSVIIAIIVRYLWKHPEILTGPLHTFQARFVLSKKYLDAYGISLFGKNIVSGTNVSLPNINNRGYYFLDNGYFRVLINFGLPTFILMIYLLIKRLMTILRKIDIYDLVIFSSCCLYFFSEGQFITIYMLPLTIELANGIYNRNGIDKSNLINKIKIKNRIKKIYMER